MTQFKRHTYEKPKSKPKTVLVTCAACLARYHLTIVGFANEYVDLVRTTKCQKCGEVKLATSDLAKTQTRAKTLQLSLDFKRGGTHDSLERRKR
jgi:hypothetical protein